MKFILSKIILSKIFLLMGCLVFFAVGCVQQRHAQSAELATFHNGGLVLPENPDVPKLIYVDAHQSARHAPNLNRYLGEAVAKGKFRLADTPSKAGYILHVNILKDGQVSKQSLENAVNAGYGHKPGFSGSGAKAMLVDALLVQRRIPKEKRPSRQRLRNISSRNAVDSARMRLAIMSENSKNSPAAEEFSKAMAAELALRLEKMN